MSLCLCISDMFLELLEANNHGFCALLAEGVRAGAKAAAIACVASAIPTVLNLFWSNLCCYM